MKHEHLNPGAVRTDCHPADPAAQFKRMGEKPAFVKIKK